MQNYNYPNYLTHNNRYLALLRPQEEQRQEEQQTPNMPSGLLDRLMAGNGLESGVGVGAGGMGAEPAAANQFGGWSSPTWGGASANAGGAAGGGTAGGAGGAAGGAGGGMWSSAGSAGPVGLMILGSLLAQYGSQSAFEPGSTGGKTTDALFPTLTGNIDFDNPGKSNWGNLGSQALGLGPLGAFLFPRDKDSMNEGTMVFGGF